MKIYFILIGLMYLIACFYESEQEQSKNEIQETNNLKYKIAKYTLVRDDLYSDSDGNLYLKSIDNEGFDDKGNLCPKDAQLTNVFIDSITQTDNGFDYIDLKLKDIVDKETWRHDSTSKNGRFIYYSDKKNIFYHQTMADGGTISVLKK